MESNNYAHSTLVLRLLLVLQLPEGIAPLPYALDSLNTLKLQRNKAPVNQSAPAPPTLVLLVIKAS